MIARIKRWADSAVTGFFQPLAIALLFLLVALLWTFLLQRVMAYPFVFLFLAAIIGSAWFGGFTSGLIATALSTLVIEFFFLPPFYSLFVGPESRSDLAGFFLCAMTAAIISSARKRAEAQVRAARDQLEVKVEERTAELRKAVGETLERERQLRLLTEAIPQQIWRANADGAIAYCNSDLAAYTGCTAESLKGDAFFRVMHPEDMRRFRAGWDAARTAGSRFEARARIRGADGGYRWSIVRALPQLDSDGNIARWYGVHIDIEEEQRAQDQLQAARNELNRLSGMLGMAEMTAAIAHELNQPLMAVTSHAQACRRWLSAEQPNVERASAAAEKLVRESSRASAVVSRVRSLFEHSSHALEPTDLNSVIEELAPVLRSEATRRNITVEISLGNELPQVAADPVQIQQVVFNLAMNGMDAMAGCGPDAVLEVRTLRKDENEVIIAVRDRGAGLSEDAKGRMFEPFFSTKPKNIGMGLAICRSILDAHEGRIWATTADPGTEFFVSLKASA
jgi:PAS domain S-box-containing protein